MIQRTTKILWLALIVVSVVTLLLFQTDSEGAHIFASLLAIFVGFPVATLSIISTVLTLISRARRHPITDRAQLPQDSLTTSTSETSAAAGDDQWASPATAFAESQSDAAIEASNYRHYELASGTYGYAITGTQYRQQAIASVLPMLARKSHVAAANGARGLPWWGPGDGRHQRPHHGAVSGPGREVPATLRLWVAGPATPTWERGCLASTNGLALRDPFRAQSHGRSASISDSRHAASPGQPDSAGR